MNYVIMSVEDALKLLGKNGKVLVFAQDLEKNEECLGFVKKNKTECENIIKEAETVGRVCDDFVSQLRVFSEKQMDVINFQPVGKLHTILFKECS